MIHTERLTAHIEGNVVVFRIGMRINKPWKVHKWWPVTRAMPRMLGGEIWFGRTTIAVQYWRSMEQLLAYAKDRAAAHLPAWRAFNQSVGSTGDVGIWHETHLVSPGSYETLYHNMPVFGLGKAGALIAASGARESAEARLKASGGER